MGILAGILAGIVAGGVWAVAVAGEVGACVWLGEVVASAGDIARIVAGSVARVGFMGGADRYAAGIFLDLSAGRVPRRGAGAFVVFAGIVAGILAADRWWSPESIGMSHVSGSERVVGRGVAGDVAGDVAGAERVSVAGDVAACATLECMSDIAGMFAVFVAGGAASFGSAAGVVGCKARISESLDGSDASRRGVAAVVCIAGIVAGIFARDIAGAGRCVGVMMVAVFAGILV